MNHRDISALMAGLAPVVRDYVADAFKGIGDRVAALETREPAKGERGDVGERGEKGEAGEKGEVGEKGGAGPVGEPGKPGDPGGPGEKGEKGEAGLGDPGIDGKDGTPGRDGQPGVPGRDGLNGKDGAPGLDGKDGFGLEDFTLSSEDGGRTFAMSFQRGDLVIRRECKTDIVLDRGVWRDGAFAKGDGVTWGGSFWIAQKDTATKPDTPASEWRLAVKRGRDGKDGKPGQKGDPGLKGDRGDPGPRGFGG